MRRGMIYWRYLTSLVGRPPLKPSFFLIGAQKSGTTSLFRHLEDHPCILSPLGKEPHFFDQRYQKGVRWYESWFPSVKDAAHTPCEGEAITGEGSTHYLFDAHTPARLKEYCPDAKLVAILRNPAERAYSAYQHEVRKKREKRSFSEVVEDELRWGEEEHAKVVADPTYWSKRHYFRSHLRRGHYAESMKRWFSVFPREQFLIFSSDQFFSDPETVYNETVAFLGLPPHKLDHFKAHNTGGYSSKIPADELQRLKEHFAPLNEELYELLGVDYGW
ncbi:sulfotransferase domain-containing protein [bacterium]|nr:sulfotransferase domain-containing protein [bacterium]